MSFIESPRFPAAIRYGSDGGPGYRTDIVEMDSGAEQRNRKWAYPRYRVNANVVRAQSDLEALIAFFHVAAGRANGFRFRDEYDYKSCAMSATPAPTDQNIGTGDGATTAFQLRKGYTQGSTTQWRLIRKPVEGTVSVAVSGVTEPARWSVDATTGIVTFSADVSDTVTGAADAGGGITRITTSANHGLGAGDTVYLSGFTGDWSALNSTRFAIVAVPAGNQFDITYDSSAFAAYSGNGGQVNTLPQSGEVVTAGFEFDIPMRFDTDQLSTSWEAYQLGEASVPLVEILP